MGSPGTADRWAIAMHLDNRILDQAYGAQADAPATIRLPTQQHAVSYLRQILEDERGVRVLGGPALSGKTTVVRCFAEDLPSDVAVAVVDGAGSTGHGFLCRVLSQFGYRVDLSSADDLLKMVTVFAIQQTRSAQPPIIVVENFEKMQLGGLRIVAALASARYQGTYAVRLVLTGGKRVQSLLKSQSMASIAERIESVLELSSLSPMESTLLLHGRLNEYGVRPADDVLPIDVCDALHELSGGLPGLLLQNARMAVEEGGAIPVNVAAVNRLREKQTDNPKMPRLIVTANGQVIEEYVFRERKVTLGRSNIADIVIYDEYASKFHALLVLYSDALILIDLNSANGTYVNSSRVTGTILRSNDIISLANYRIKVLDAPEGESDRLAELVTSETAKMKTLEEARAEKVRKRQRYLSGSDDHSLLGTSD